MTGADPGRLLSVDVLRHPLTHEALPDGDVVEGAPTAGVTSLAGLGEVGVGIWEMSTGTARDTEVDEVFVVVSGRGSVEFDDGTVLDLGPGTAVRLTAGERTTWTVTETLRKIWVA